MAQQLPLVQIPMPQQQPIIGVDMTQQDYNNLQQQGLLPSQLQQPQVVMNDGQSPNGGFENIRMNQQPQVIDVAPQSQPRPIIGNAGAQRRGVDWAGLLGTLGSYASAAGSAYGTGANPSQGLLNATNATRKLTQDINQYNAMAPAYRQMGIDPTRFDPRRGGAGIATTPTEMIDLQSKIAERDYLNDYRQTMAEARLAQQQQKQQSMPTVGDLMLYNPQFKAMMNAQYDFSGGKNADILKRPVPKELLMNVLPKNVNMRYSGGLQSSKTSTATIKHEGGSGGGKKTGKGKKPGISLIIN